MLLLNLLYKYRLLLLIIILGFCIWGAKYAKSTLRPSNAVSIWFSKNDSALNAYFDFQKQFGNDRILILAFKQKDGILTAKSLQKIEALTNGLSSIQGVKEVISIINAKDFRRIKNEGITRINYVSWFENNPKYLISDKLKEEVLSSPLIVNKFINKTGTVTLVVIRMAQLREIDDKIHAIISHIRSTADQILGKGNVHLSGTDIITDSLNQLSNRDFTLFAALGFGFMFLVILVFYRRMAYMLLVFLVSSAAIWVSLIIHGILGFRLNIFTVICPPLIITLGIISIVHIINEYEQLLIKNTGEKSSELTKQTLKNILKPCFFSTATTIIGFSSLYTSPTSVLKEFALLSSVGFFLLFIFSLIFSCIILPFQKKASNTPRTVTLLETVSRHIIKRSVIYSVGSVIVVGIFLYGASKIKNDMYPLGYFPKNHTLVKDHQFIIDNWGDYYPVDMVLTTDSAHNLSKPETVRALLNFGKEISKNPIVKDRFDFSQVMQRYARVAFKKNMEEILDDPFLSERFVEQFMMGIRDNAESIISNDLKKARITITGPMLSTRQLEENLNAIDTIASKHFTQNMELSVTGYPALYIKIMNYALDSMESSLYTCFILIFLSMALLLWSIRIALLAIVPNIFPVIILLGFLGLSGINLDLATCTIAAIVLGISVDDTIFFLHYFQKTKSKDVTVEENILRTYHHVGRAIFIATLIMLAGFSVMLFASLKTVFYFGLLAIVSVISAALGEMVILPLLMKYTHNKKWWNRKQLQIRQ